MLNGRLRSYFLSEPASVKGARASPVDAQEQPA